MNDPNSRPAASAPPMIERLQPRIAAATSALLHVLLAWWLLSSRPLPMTPPQGASGGSPMVVDFVGIDRAPPPPAVRPTPPTPRPEPEPVAKAPAASRLQTTTVLQADAPLSPHTVADDADDDAARQAARAPEASAAPPSRQRGRGWGMPPGMLQEETAPVHAAPTRGNAAARGRGSDSSDEANMSAGGYQVYYDVRSERQMLEWRDAGMTEIAFALPGTRKRMVCLLETAMRRESGPCRLLDPESPEMATIGDAYQVINVQQVYRQGELLWRGPKPYR